MPDRLIPTVKALLLPLLFLALLLQSASAQQRAEDAERVARLFDYLYGDETPDGRDVVREGIREKLRVSPSELAELLGVEAPAEFVGGPEKVIEPMRVAEETRETAINASSDIEAELHAAINPTDSNNIVVGVISLFGGGGRDDDNPLLHSRLRTYLDQEQPYVPDEGV